MFEAIIQALLNFGSLELWLIILAGIAIGLIFGLIPGLSGTVALALLMPFAFVMKPEQALPLMVAILASQFSGGAITSILINVPGTPTNAATMLDGFPMTKKGEAGRALGAAQMASAMGSTITAVLSLVMLPLILPVVLSLRSADMVFVILVGLAFITVLASGSMLKGVISGGAGLILSFIGHQAVTGIDRLTFGVPYLYEGLPFIPICLGLFAVPEMLSLAARGGSLAGSDTEVRGMEDVMRGVRDVIHHWALFLRSMIIGFIVGIIPGVGGVTATFVAYAQARQTSKHPETFGTGNVEGVIAPESANNACETGALLTLLALGLPGNAPGAVLLGALIVLGIQPGPKMLTEHLDLSITLIWGVLISAIIGAAICVLLAPRLARIAWIPGRILAPLVMSIVFAGAFGFREEPNDLIVLVVFGALGLVMTRYGYSRPALIVGCILGSIFETYLFIALQLDGPIFFMRPISLGLIFVFFAVLAYDPVRHALSRRKGVKKA